MHDLPAGFVADLRQLGRWPELTDTVWRSPRLVELTYGRLWSLVAEVLPPAPARILDAGSGLGALSLEMARLGHDVVGIDPSEAALAVAERAQDRAAPGRLSYVRAEVETWDGDRSGFDVVVTTRVLHHVDDPALVVERLHSWLRPGGCLVCVDFGHDRFDRRAARWLAQTRGLLEAAGRTGPDGRLPADPAAAVERIEWEWHQDHVVDHQLNPLAAIEGPLRARFPGGTWSWHPYLYWDLVDRLDAASLQVEAQLGHLLADWEASLLATGDLPTLLFRLVATT